MQFAAFFFVVLTVGPVSMVFSMTESAIRLASIPGIAFPDRTL